MENKSEIRTEIYGKRNFKDNTQQRLQSWSGSPRNKELIKEFTNTLLVKGTQFNRISKLTYQLIFIAELLEKDFDKATDKDLIKIIAKINTNPAHSVVTQADYRRAVKTFYKWLEEEDPRFKGNQETIEEARKFYKYLHKNVTITYKERTLNYSEIITEEDAKILIEKGCDNSMEKAIISFLFESGARVGELLNMRIRDVEYKENYAMVRVDGKTGQRRIPIIQSIAYIKRWIEEHPDRENKNALLWVSKHNGHYGKPLIHAGLMKLTKRVYEKAGYKGKKKCNPHWFRHSRATLLSTEYTEVVLCKIMGWKIGSKQVKTYVHLGAGQVEDAFRQNQGLEIKKIEKRALFCVCGITNPSGSKYCLKCGQALNIAVLMEDKKKKDDAVSEAFELFARIMSNPELKAKFEAFKSNTKEFP